MTLADQLAQGRGRISPAASSAWFDEDNTRQIAQLDPVKTVSACMSLESPDERWRVVAAGRNLTDERYSQGGNPSFTSSSGYAEAS